MWWSMFLLVLIIIKIMQCNINRGKTETGEKNERRPVHIHTSGCGHWEHASFADTDLFATRVLGHRLGSLADRVLAQFAR